MSSSVIRARPKSRIFTVAVGADVVDGEDIGVVQRRKRLCLLAETLDGFFPGQVSGVQFLDSELLVELVYNEIHIGAGTYPQRLSLDFIRADTVPFI